MGRWRWRTTAAVGTASLLVWVVKLLSVSSWCSNSEKKSSARWIALLVLVLVLVLVTVRVRVRRSRSVPRTRRRRRRLATRQCGCCSGSDRDRPPSRRPPALSSSLSRTATCGVSSNRKGRAYYIVDPYCILKLLRKRNNRNLVWYFVPIILFIEKFVTCIADRPSLHYY